MFFLKPDGKQASLDAKHFIPKVHSQNKQQTLLLPLHGKQQVTSCITPRKDPSQNNQQIHLLPSGGSAKQHSLLSQRVSSLSIAKKNTQNRQSTLKPGAHNATSNTPHHESNITLGNSTCENKSNVTKGSTRDEVLNYCTSCKLLFSSFSSFETHMSKYHNIYCTVCKQLCASLSSLEKHMAEHHNISKGLLRKSTVQNDSGATLSNTAQKCKSNITVNNVNLENESNVILENIRENDFNITGANHSNVKPGNIPSKISFNQLEGLSLQKALNYCTICNNLFTSWASFEEHMTKMHNESQDKLLMKKIVNVSDGKLDTQFPDSMVSEPISEEQLVNENPEPLDQPDTNGELSDPNDSNKMGALTRQVILDEIGSIHTTTYKGWHVAVGEHIDFLLYDNLQVSKRHCISWACTKALIHKINRCDKSFNRDRARICSHHFKLSCLTHLNS